MTPEENARPEITELEDGRVVTTVKFSSAIIGSKDIPSHTPDGRLIEWHLRRADREEPGREEWFGTIQSE